MRANRELLFISNAGIKEPFLEAGPGTGGPLLPASAVWAWAMCPVQPCRDGPGRTKGFWLFSAIWYKHGEEIGRPGAGHTQAPGCSWCHAAHPYVGARARRPAWPHSHTQGAQPVGMSASSPGWAQGSRICPTWTAPSGSFQVPLSDQEVDQGGQKGGSGNSTVLIFYLITMRTIGGRGLSLISHHSLIRMELSEHIRGPVWDLLLLLGEKTAGGCLSFHPSHSQGSHTDEPAFVFHLGCCIMVWVRGRRSYLPINCACYSISRDHAQGSKTLPYFLHLSSVLMLISVFPELKLCCYELWNPSEETLEEGAQRYLGRICYLKLHNCAVEILTLLWRSEGRCRICLTGCLQGWHSLWPLYEVCALEYEVWLASPAALEASW